MRETRWNGLSVVLVWGFVHCECANVLCINRTLVGWWVDDNVWVMKQQESVRKGKSWEKRKKGERREKWFEEKEHLFAFEWLCLSLHPFPPFNPPCHHSSSYAHTHTPYSTPQHTTQAHLCAVLFLSLCVTVRALNPHSIEQHNTVQSVHPNHSMALNEEHRLSRVWAKWHGRGWDECLLTRLATMHGVLHTKSLSEHSKQTGASVAREWQWMMCTLSADSWNHCGRSSRK